MKMSLRFLMLLLVIGACGGVVRAEEDGRGGEVRGTFVRLVERKVGEAWYLGIVSRWRAIA